MKKDAIVKSFKCCGISGAIDGSEDDDISIFKPGRGCEGGLNLLKSRGEEDEQDVEVDEEEELRLLNCDSDEDLLTDGELENDESEIIDDDLEDL